MNEQRPEYVLKGRRQQGNQSWRRMNQLKELENRSGGAFRYLEYRRDGATYRVQVDDQIYVLRSRDIDPFVTGIETGIRVLGALRPPSGTAAAALFRSTLEAPLSGLEPAQMLAEPEPQATVAALGAAQTGETGRLRAVWPAVAGADRYTVEARNRDLKNPVWRPVGQTTSPAVEAELPYGQQWELRVRAEDTTGNRAASDWAVVSVTPAISK